MTPVQLLQSALDATDPMEKRRLLRECLTALPPWDMKADPYNMRPDKGVEHLLGAAISFLASRESHPEDPAFVRAAQRRIAAALALLPGTLTEDSIRGSLDAVADAISGAIPRTSASVGGRVCTALYAIGHDASGSFGDANLPQSVTDAIDAALFRAGGALADVLDSLSRGERVGAALIAESYLRRALALATGSAS